MHIICVGGASSQGFDLLNKVLQLLPQIDCYQNLGLFSSSAAYDFDEDFKSTAIKRIPVAPQASYLNRSPYLNEAAYATAGLNFNTCLENLEKARDFSEFVHKVCTQNALQERSQYDAVVEMTPQNIQQSHRFCHDFPAHTFIHVTSDIRTAMPYFEARGFTPYEALMIWTSEHARGLMASRQTNYQLLQMEKFIEDPLSTLGALFTRIGWNLEELLASSNLKSEVQYIANKYKQSHLEELSSLNSTVLNISGDWFLETANPVFFNENQRVTIDHLLTSMGYESLKKNSTRNISVQGEPEWLIQARKNYAKHARHGMLQSRYRISAEGYNVFHPSPMNSIAKDDQTKKPLRVLHGVSGQAGQPDTLARALRVRGNFAHSVSLARHPFAYLSDIQINPTSSSSGSELIGSIINLANSYDIFHFHAKSFCTRFSNLSYPSLMDVFYLKAMGKKVFFHFRGSEVRNKEKFDIENPYAFKPHEKDALEIFDDMSTASKQSVLDITRNLCDGVFVVDEEIRSYVGSDAIIVPRAVDLSRYVLSQASDRAVPHIVHAPSRRQVKGTEYIVNAIERLNARGVKCTLELVEGLKHEDALRRYAEADIVVDQLRLGWYGVLAVEAFALGKPVVCYIRDDLLQSSGLDLPIMNANPNTIENALERLVKDRLFRVNLGIRARDFCHQYHDAFQVAKNLEYYYNVCERKSTSVDWLKYAHLLDAQINQEVIKRQHYNETWKGITKLVLKRFGFKT